MLIREQLFEKQDEKYRLFSSSLIPNAENIIGVRMPELRNMAKEIVKEDWHSFLTTAAGDFFEEVLLQGIVIGYAHMDIEERLQWVERFVPNIPNWSICDSFCSGLKMTKNNQAYVLAFLQQYIDSDKEYEVRFAVVMLLNYYIEERYIERVLEQLEQVNHDGYYVKMAVAWAISICFIKLPAQTMPFLLSNTLDDFTYNKALQKITESTRISDALKKQIKKMKRVRGL